MGRTELLAIMSALISTSNRMFSAKDSAECAELLLDEIERRTGFVIPIEKEKTDETDKRGTGGEAA